MAELRYEQLFIADTPQAEFCGKVLAVRNEKTYEIAVMSEGMAWPTASEDCTVYYQGSEEQRRVFTGVLIPEGSSTLIVKQMKTATADKRRHLRLRAEGVFAVLKKEDRVKKNVLRAVWALLRGAKKSIKVQVLDICEGGIGIISRFTLPLKEKFLIELTMNEDKVPAIVDVRYCLAKENLFVAGLEFGVISEEASRKVRRFISRELQRKSGLGEAINL